MSKKLITSLGGVAKLRKRCFDAVARWEWYSGRLARDPVPYLSEAGGFGTPKPLAKEPKDKSKAAKVGIDAAGRTVVRQTYFVYQGKAYPHDELFHYDDSRIVSVRLETTMAGAPQELGEIRELKLKDGRVVASGKSKYHYDARGLLERAEHPHVTLTYQFDVLGQLVSVASPREKRYQRKPAGVTMASTMKRIEGLLLEAIPAVLAAHAPPEPVQVFALVHSLRMTALPPLIGLQLERETGKLVAEKDPERAFWDPIEWELFEDERFELRSAELAMACETAHQLCVDAGTIEPVRKMLWKVVGALRDRLPKLLRTGKRFAALVIHAEHDGLDKDLKQLKKALPAASKKAWAELLP